MVGWHHGLNGCGFGWTLGVGDGQGGAGLQPRWIQGNLKRRQSRRGKTYLFRNIKERLGKNSIVGKFSGEKSLNNLVYVEN